MGYGIFLKKMELIFNLMYFGNGIKGKKLKVLLLLQDTHQITLELESVCMAAT